MPRQLSTTVGRFHFIGIGGIGMSGIAELMHSLGYAVSGSDQSDSAMLQRLSSLGIPVCVGHEHDLIAGAQFVVRSSAIKPDNPEIIRASKDGLVIVHRAEMLAEMMYLKQAIAVAGTHGKTTTTSMIAHLLEHGALKPTVVNGGIINYYGSNARVGSGPWMVVEADESDGSFMRLPYVASVITNIDPEHLDHYGDFDAVRRAFHRFADQAPFFGFLVLCMDHPELQMLYRHVCGASSDTDTLQGTRRVISYGFHLHAEIRAENIRMQDQQQYFDVYVPDNPHKADAISRHVMSIPMPGEHNVSNALAAIAVARELGLDMATIREGLSSFGGVRRRFQITGQAHGATFIDDYAHHPTEIKAVLQAARSYTQGRVLVLFQPHRYSRLADLYQEFLAALLQTDCLWVMPVYAAGESPIAGIDHHQFVVDICQQGHDDAVVISDSETAMAAQIVPKLDTGDVVLCLGAGSISRFAHALPDMCKEITP